MLKRPDPKGLSTFSQCTEIPSHRGFVLKSSRSGVRRFNEMASKSMLVWVSQQASLQCSLQYSFGTEHGLGLVEKYCLPWHRASEAALDVPSCERYAAR
jgi:hypothetical protein